MKIALINPLYKNLYGEMKSALGIFPPLGLGLIAAVLQKNEHLVRLIDMEAEGLGESGLFAELSKFSPDLIGMYSSTPIIFYVFDLAKKLKENFPAPIVLGGPHPSSFPEDAIKNGSIDFVVRGEGEYVMLDLIKTLESKSPLNLAAGLTYKQGGKIYSNPPQKYIENLDALPFPAHELLPMDKYYPYSYLDKRGRWFTMLTTRGCPFGCIFCNSGSIFGKAYRVRSPKNIVKEVEKLNKDYDVKNILFVDDTFTLNREATIEFCRLLHENNLRISWSCETRVNLVDPELLKKMKLSGCFEIAFGIESGSQKMLNNLKKGITLEQSERAVRATKNAGIKTRTFWVFGAPGETRETVLQSIEFAKKLNPDIAHFNVMTPYPDTEIYKMAVREGVVDYDWSKYFSIGERPAYETKDLSKDDLAKLLKKAHRDFYFRPSYILKSLMKIRNPRQLKRLIKSGIGIFKTMR